MATVRSHYTDAVRHARAARLSEALAALAAAIEADSKDSAALTLLASVQLQIGDPQAAIVAADRALALDAANVHAHCSRADALARLSRRGEALAGYEAALAVEPAHLAALVNRAALLIDLGRPDPALASCDAALAIDPSIAEAHGAKARALLQLHRGDAALQAADRALALRPDYVRAWISRGDAMRVLRRFEAAVACFEFALRLEPRAYSAQASLGSALRSLGRYQEAIAAFDAAERIAPDGGTAAFERALVKLLLGDFEAGWRDMAARWRSPEFAATSGFVTPAMRDRLTLLPKASDFVGRRVLLLCEQGIGDQLMLLSMLPDLLSVAASVACVCERRLVRLLSSSFPEVCFFDSRDGAPAGLDEPDMAVAAGDLGSAFRNRRADFPGEPYVRPRPAVVEAWAARLGTRRAPHRIGLSWRGGALATNREGRSIPLAQFARLLTHKDLEIVSLQYGDVDDEVAAIRAQFGVDLRVFPRAEIDDFEDLAALVQNLDLVISVQTAMVHLSGALGKTCLAMVPVQPEWRYLTAGEAMPWYRSVRIFRQDATECWAPVIDRVVAAVGLTLG